MRRPWHIWIAFAACLAVVLGALAWVSLSVLRLHRVEVSAAVQATHEEEVRLALWRLDSAVAPLVAQENARPYFAYSAFYPLERAYTRMFNKLEYGDVVVPSPLLARDVPYVRLHFQCGPDGKVTSPQAPEGNMRDLAEARYVAPEKVAAAQGKLAELQQWLRRETLLALIPREDALALAGTGGNSQLTTAENPNQPPAGIYYLAPGDSQAAANGANHLPQTSQNLNLANGGNLLANLGQQGQIDVNSPALQQARSNQEYNARAARVTNDAQRQVEQQQYAAPDEVKGGKKAAGTDVRLGLLRPVWVGEQLLLARRVQVNGTEYVQGCWLDWPTIRAELLQSVQHVIPGSQLEPVPAPSADGQSRLLASLPVRLVPGPPPAAPAIGWWSPTVLMLLVAWLGAGLAALAVAVLLQGVMSLSERRASFVSAVTHEMRTPLTTFRLYTELLSEGMVTEPAKRTSYLHTLRVEAQRLAHLVENVLAYARLERGRAADRTESTTVGAVLERMEQRLADRAGQGGMTLVVEAPEEQRACPVRVKSSSVEQVIYNLVDNACKYARGAADKRIHLETGCRDGVTWLRVRDHGPGITAEEACKLFRPFSKSAREAAQTAPGVGLGLALSRRLARAMGGELRLDGAVTDGACFELTLPKA